jgi:hypothetical protein
VSASNPLGMGNLGNAIMIRLSIKLSGYGQV